MILDFGTLKKVNFLYYLWVWVKEVDDMNVGINLIEEKSKI